MTALRKCLETNVGIENIDVSDNGLFGLPLKPATSLPLGLAGIFQADACIELCMALHGNTKIGGNLRVLNILKNRIPGCESVRGINEMDSPYAHSPVREKEMWMKKKYNYNNNREAIENKYAEFWRHENVVRPAIHPQHLMCSI